jgi:hypothetical protein
MFPRPLDRTTKAALAAAGLALFLGGAGWALAGDQVFLATFMAGLAGCF